MFAAYGVPVWREIPAHARLATIVVDALLGTGTRGQASGRVLEGIAESNTEDKQKAGYSGSWVTFKQRSAPPNGSRTVWVTRSTVQLPPGSPAAVATTWSDRNLAPSGKSRFYRIIDTTPKTAP